MGSIKVSTINVHRDEVAELKSYLENKCWDWKEEDVVETPKKDLNILNKEDSDALEHAVINGLETDFEKQEYDSMSELLQALFKLKGAPDIFINYLSDQLKEDLLEGRIKFRY